MLHLLSQNHVASPQCAIRIRQPKTHSCTGCWERTTPDANQSSANAVPHRSDVKPTWSDAQQLQGNGCYTSLLPWHGIPAPTAIEWCELTSGGVNRTFCHATKHRPLPNRINSFQHCTRYQPPAIKHLFHAKHSPPTPPSQLSMHCIVPGRSPPLSRTCNTATRITPHLVPTPISPFLIISATALSVLPVAWYSCELLNLNSTTIPRCPINVLFAE